MTDQELHKYIGLLYEQMSSYDFKATRTPDRITKETLLQRKMEIQAAYSRATDEAYLRGTYQ